MQLWITGALIVIVAGLLHRARLERYRREAAISDDQVRQIMERGRIEVDEPLDLQHIQEEEARFLEETAWDEPEEN
jgi:hypothetical protein